MITGRVGLWGVDHTVAARPGAKTSRWSGGKCYSDNEADALLFRMWDSHARRRPDTDPFQSRGFVSSIRGIGEGGNGWE